MATQYRTRYLANTNKREVHDLHHESERCQLKEIIAAGHDRAYTSLEAALNDGHDKCQWCLGDSKR